MISRTITRSLYADDMAFIMRSPYPVLIFGRSKAETLNAGVDHPEALMNIIDADFVGVDGYETTGDIRNFNQKIQFILITRHLTLNSFPLASLVEVTNLFRSWWDPQYLRV